MPVSDSPRFDFHCHSRASDGDLTPAELVARALERGVEYLALTDHDTLAGLAEARAAAADRLTLVPGIELSVRWQTRELHLVGLAFDPDHAGLQALVAAQQDARVLRARSMGRRLDKVAGLANTYERVVARSGQDAPGRPWFAALLVDEGRARDMQHAFNRFLRPGQSAFVATPWVLLEDGIRVIREAGGVAVLAHPLRYGMTRRKLRQLLTDFAAAGGQALEVLTPGVTEPQRQLLDECLRDFGLLASGGSDFHSPRQKWLDLGQVPPPAPAMTPVWRAFAPPWQMA